MFGLIVYSVLIVAMQFTVAQLTSTWTWLTHVLIWASIAGYMLFVYAYCSAQYSQHLWGVAAETFVTSALYATGALVLVVMFCVAALIHLGTALLKNVRCVRVKNARVGNAA